MIKSDIKLRKGSVFRCHTKNKDDPELKEVILTEIREYKKDRMRKLEEERLLRKSMLEAEWMIKKNKKVNKQKG